MSGYRIAFCPMIGGLAILLLGACNRDSEHNNQAQQQDSMNIAALQGPAMTDPDLVYRNTAGQALTAGGPPVIELPAIEISPEAIAEAKAEAEKLLKSSANPLPSPQQGVDSVVRDAITARQLVGGMKGVSNDCVEKIGYTLSWSLRLPAPFPIYPRGHLQDAAGADKAGCTVRVVSFITPVAPTDIMAFYYAKASGYNISSVYRAEDAEIAVQTLDGARTGFAYRVRVRQFQSGISSVDLITSSE